MKARPTTIAGVLRVELEVKPNDGGWFKENFHRAKLAELGLDVVQHNVAYFEEAGVLRGIHAEPWDKYLSPTSGRVLAAVVELRDNAAFVRVETFELGTSDALYVPRGVGNSFCTLTPHTTYNLLVNEHWSPERIAVDPFDPELAIEWPAEDLKYTERDAASPSLEDLRRQRA
ncbi:dTDP-4-dehydrorhamnose 3,5-epimerase family protein [Kribbella shirazensis]|uniref:dTDP-4-dehydrorhamnose 3,5-epimerase n=1 Tax=Kribbella shirazensis TaxID=1105143 RepID=A0A7X5V5C1_9ACTN|nr:dTDP-4-dehydrorhamnose 3,5-epimerase [Kribbella shirazensis]